MTKKPKTTYYDEYNFQDKQECQRAYINTMLERTIQMFEYEGLPETIDSLMMEKRLQRNGSIVITYIKEEDILKLDDGYDISEGYYAFDTSPAGVMDFNGNPTFVIIAHPRLKRSLTLTLGKDAVLIKNDTLMMGVLPIFRRYASQLVENDLTMTIADIYSRMPSIISTGDSNGFEAAKEMIKRVRNGEFGVVVDDSWMEQNKLSTMPYATSANNSLTNLIEYQQYIKASWFNEMGLSSNYNMKRESINSSEAQLGQEALLPLIDDYLHSRIEGFKEVERVFGISITPSFHSGWKHVEDDLINDEEGGVDDDENNSDKASEVRDEDNSGE